MLKQISEAFCGGRAKIEVATSICTGRSNMPPAYCDFDLRAPQLDIKKRRSGLSFTLLKQISEAFCGGRAKIEVATSICTGRSNMPPAYCDFDLRAPQLDIKKRRSGLSFTPSYIGTPEGTRLHFCPCGGRAKIEVATSICTGRSNMPLAYCDFIVRVR